MEDSTCLENNKSKILGFETTKQDKENPGCMLTSHGNEHVGSENDEEMSLTKKAKNNLMEGNYITNPLKYNFTKSVNITALAIKAIVAMLSKVKLQKIKERIVKNLTASHNPLADLVDYPTIINEDQWTWRREEEESEDLQMQKGRERGDKNDEMVAGKSTGNEENEAIKQTKKQKN